MRIVIDTNVFVSAAMRETSVPGLAVLLTITDHHVLVSEITEQELLRVIAKPQLAKLISKGFVAWLSRNLSALEKTIITETVRECRDPDDDKFLELAINGKADVIISGDKDLLTMHPFRGIPVLTPAAFLSWRD